MIIFVILLLIIVVRNQVVTNEKLTKLENTLNKWGNALDEFVLYYEAMPQESEGKRGTKNSKDEKRHARPRRESMGKSTIGGTKKKADKSQMARKVVGQSTSTANSSKRK